MKKLYSIITMAVLALSSQAAIQVTCNNQALTNGQEISLSFQKVDIIPGIMSKYMAEASISISGTSPIKVQAETDQPNVIQYCQVGGSCGVFGADGIVYTSEMQVTSSPAEFKIDASYNSFPENATGYLSLVISDASNSSINIKFKYNTAASGVDAVEMSSDYVRATGRSLIYNFAQPTVVTVYSIAGNTVINASVNGDGQLSLDALHPGIYIYRAGAYTGKILVR